MAIILLSGHPSKCNESACASGRREGRGANEADTVARWIAKDRHDDSTCLRNWHLRVPAECEHLL